MRRPRKVLSNASAPIPTLKENIKVRALTFVSFFDVVVVVVVEDTGDAELVVL